MLPATRSAAALDTVKATTTLVSVNRIGTGGGNGPSFDGAIGDDGRFVAFVSFADDLVATDTNKNSDVFIRDLLFGTTTLVSVNRAGADSGRGQNKRFTYDSLGRLSQSAEYR